jgi:hypothetical protein
MPRRLSARKRLLQESWASTSRPVDAGVGLGLGAVDVNVTADETVAHFRPEVDQVM